MPSVLTLAEARAFPELAGFADAALQLAIDDVESEIVDRFGAYGVGARTESLLLRSRTERLVLRRRPASISSIVEYLSPGVSRTLDPTDYRLAGYVLFRLLPGANPGYWWGTDFGEFRVDVTYVPAGDDTVRRKMATIDVLKLEAAFSGGGTVRIGDYERRTGASAGASDQVTKDRARILGRLRPRAFVFA